MVKLADRVKETTTSTGTGAINLEGAPVGYQSFSDAFIDNDEVSVVIVGGNDWEISTGTLTAGTPWTYTRDTILDSSNSGAAVDFGAGSKDVFVTVPAGTLELTAKTNQEQTYTAQQVPMNGALSDGATINWDAAVNGQIVSVTTADSRTFAAPTNIIQNVPYVLILNSGDFTPTFDTAFKWAFGEAPTSFIGTCILNFVGGADNTMLSTGIQVDVR